MAQKLANSGIKTGSQAATNATRDLESGLGQAYNQAHVGNFTTAQNSATAQRDLPISELSQLLGGTTPAPVTNGGTNFGQLQQNQYQNQLDQYNGFWNGAGNIASTAGSFLFSDRNLKTDIGETGMKTPDGIPMKTWRYKGSPMMELGVIAQDVEKKRPDAVTTIMGKKAVDYSRIQSPMLNLGRKAA